MGSEWTRQTRTCMQMRCVWHSPSFCTQSGDWGEMHLLCKWGVLWIYLRGWVLSGQCVRCDAASDTRVTAAWHVAKWRWPRIDALFFSSCTPSRWASRRKWLAASEPRCYTLPPHLISYLILTWFHFFYLITDWWQRILSLIDGLPFFLFIYTAS